MSQLVKRLTQFVHRYSDSSLDCAYRNSKLFGDPRMRQTREVGQFKRDPLLTIQSRDRRPYNSGALGLVEFLGPDPAPC
jgi:hypothetical protein